MQQTKINDCKIKVWSIIECRPSQVQFWVHYFLKLMWLIFYMNMENSEIKNYADDTTLCCSASDIPRVSSKSQVTSTFLTGSIMTIWNTKILANNYQLIVLADLTPFFRSALLILPFFYRYLKPSFLLPFCNLLIYCTLGTFSESYW